MAHSAPPHHHQSPGTVTRWPAVVALTLIGGGYLILSDRFRIGPPWLVLLLGSPALPMMPRTLSIAERQGKPRGRVSLR